MRAYLIIGNWVISFVGLGVDTERTPLLVCLLMVVWFAGSTLLLNYADRKGWLDQVMKRFGLDEV